MTPRPVAAPAPASKLRDRRANPELRCRLAAGLLLAAAALNVYMVRDALKLRQSAAPTAWNAGEFVERLAPLKARLSGNAEVAYIDTIPLDSGRARILVLTRYALAPNRVVSGGNSPWLLIAGDVQAALAGFDRQPQLVFEVLPGLTLYQRAEVP